MRAFNQAQLDQYFYNAAFNQSRLDLYFYNAAFFNQSRLDLYFYNAAFLPEQTGISNSHMQPKKFFKLNAVLKKAQKALSDKEHRI